MWSVLNCLALAGVLVVNTLASTIPINGKTTGEISDAYPNLFTPAGFTFGVWGLIYLALLAFTVYQIVIVWRSGEPVDLVERISPFFILSCIANISWIFAWHYQIIWLSLLIMLILLFSLIRLYLRLQTGVAHVSQGRRWLVHLPFSLYLGWITIATMANTTIFLTDLGWAGFGLDPRFWTIFVLWAGLSIAFRVWQKRHDLVFVLVIAWAYFGIVVKRIDVTGGWQDSVAIAAGIGIAIILLMALSSIRSAK